MWLVGGGIRAPPLRVVRAAPSPSRVLLSQETEDCLLAVFEGVMDLDETCNVRSFLAALRRSKQLAVLEPNADEVLAQMGRLELDRDAFKTCVSWQQLLHLISTSTNIVRLSRVGGVRPSSSLRSKLSRTKYMLQLQRLGEDTYSDTSSESYEAPSESYRRAALALARQEGVHRLSDQQMTEVEAKALANKPKPLPSLSFDMPMEVTAAPLDLVAARLAPLSPLELATTEKILNGPASEEVVIIKFNTHMTRRDLCTLSDNTWLNDEVINFYMEMLKVRDEELCNAYPSRRHNRFMTSFFMTKLLGEGYNYANVRRWTKKFDVFAADKVFFPINVSNAHWVLAVVWVQQRKVCFYDSMAGSGERWLAALMRWIVDESKDKRGEAIDEAVWSVVKCVRSTTPQQRNGVDCGAFATMFADFLSEDLELSFSQTHMPMLRRKIAASIIRGRLDYPLPM